MSTRIPLPGSMIDTLMKGVDTGSTMYSRAMQPILDREKQKQLEQHFQEQLKLSKAAAGRNAALFPLRQKLLQAQIDAKDPNKQFEQFNRMFGGGNDSNTGTGNNQTDSYPDLHKMFSGQGAFPEGELEHGNIDLGNRPVVDNPETGGQSTVYSTSFGTPQGEILVPRVSDDGRILSEKEAQDQFHKTGKHLGIYSSPEEATKAAELIHQQQARSVGAKPGQHLLDVLRNDPLKRAFFKHIYKFDPLATVPQTPEDKQQMALDLFQKKEDIKKQSKGGDIPTNTVLTQNQQALQGIKTVIPMLDELINNPKSVYGPTDFSPSKKAAYNAKTSGMIDTLVAAQSLPKVQASIDLVEQQIRRGTNESIDSYIKRLKDLRKDLVNRKGRAKDVLSNRKVNTNDDDDFSQMSDDELRKIAGGG